MHGGSHRLHDQMGQTQMGGRLVVGGVCKVEPHLGQQPGVLGVAGQKHLCKRRFSRTKVKTGTVLVAPVWSSKSMYNRQQNRITNKQSSQWVGFD